MNSATTIPTLLSAKNDTLKLPEGYLEKLKQRKEEKMSLDKIEAKNEKNIKSFFQQPGIDLSVLDKMDAEEKKELEIFLDKVRPNLINRKSAKTNLLQQKKDYQDILHTTNRKAIEPSLAYIIHPGNVLLATTAGEHGWIFPTDPSQIKIWDNDSGSGWGWTGMASTNPPSTAVIKFIFTPDKTGTWSICPILAFEGYFITRANDTWATSKRAAVSVKVDVEVKQYNNAISKRFTVLHRGGANTRAFEFVRLTEFFDMPTALLRSNDAVEVTVTIEVNAVAKGGGSYAEINFEAGAGNYILPLMLLANPVE